MEKQKKVLKKAEELKSLVSEWIPKRKATVHTLRVLAEKLMTHHKNVCIAQVAGASTSVAGFTLAAVGFGFSFVTFGTSLILAAVGGGISFAGGATTAGSLVTEAYLRKDTFDSAQKIINEDREATKAIQKLLEEFEKQARSLMIEKGVKVGGSFAFTVKDCVETSIKLGARAGVTAASEGGEALFRGLSVAGKAAHIGGFAFSAILLPFDIYTLVTNSMKIDASRKGKKVEEPEAVKKLRKLANELAKDMQTKEEFARQIDRFVSTACTMDSDFAKIPRAKFTERDAVARWAVVHRNELAKGMPDEKEFARQIDDFASTEWTSDTGFAYSRRAKFHSQLRHHHPHRHHCHPQFSFS